MPAILHFANGRKMDVDRVFTDGGKLPVYAMIGGSKTVMEKGTLPKPTLYQKGKLFFTQDGKPATAESFQPWLDDPDFPEAMKKPFRDALEAKAPTRTQIEKVRPRKPQIRRARVLDPKEAGLPTDRAERV